MELTISLQKNKDFQHVYNYGKSKADRYMVLYVLENHQDVNRIGVSVSKKVGNSVVRHRIKRLVKENYRLQETSFQRGYDLVVIARKSLKDADYYRVGKSLMKLASLQGIVITQQNQEKKNIYDEKNHDRSDPNLSHVHFTDDRTSL